MQNKRVFRNTCCASCELYELSSSPAFYSYAVVQVDGSKLNDDNGGALVVRPPDDTLSFLLTYHHFQCYVPISPTVFRPVENKLRFTRSIPSRSLHLARRTNLLGQFVDFDDYLEDNRVQYLTNGAVEAALTSLQ